MSVHTVTFTAGSTIKDQYVDIAKLAAWQYVKVRSVTVGTPVTQASVRTITVISHLV